MPEQVHTFQVPLPRGVHEDALAQVAELFGSAQMRLNSKLRKLARDAEAGKWDKEKLNEARATLKRETMVVEGLTARQYNGLVRCLEGKHSSIQELAKLRIDKHKNQIKSLTKKIADKEKKLKAQGPNDIAIGKRAAKGREPTEAQEKKWIAPAVRAKMRFAIHNQKRKLGQLEAKLRRDEAVARAAVPPIVFGSKKLLQKRAKIHPNDQQALADWRRQWNAARHGEVMFIGSAEETAGNQTCQALLQDADAGKISLWIKMPPALVAANGLPDRLRIDGLELPSYARKDMMAALRGCVEGPDGEDELRRVAIAYRFVRDPEWHPRMRKSAWVLNITVKCKTPEVEFDATDGVLGVDVNADHLALALVKEDGNPLKAWRIDLPVRGKASEQREAIIGDAVRDVCQIAKQYGVPLVLEFLDFKEKKKELALQSKTSRNVGEKRYARMLSSFAYGQIGTMLRRRAAREGIAVRSVNPAYTSMIGRFNFSKRYGLSIHQAAAVAIARRALKHSERLNYVHGLRGRRHARPTRSESRRHVWRQWAKLNKDLARAASAQVSSASSRRPGSSNVGARGVGPMIKRSHLHGRGSSVHATRRGAARPVRARPE